MKLRPALALSYGPRRATAEIRPDLGRSDRINWTVWTRSRDRTVRVAVAETLQAAEAIAARLRG